MGINLEKPGPHGSARHELPGQAYDLLGQVQRLVEVGCEEQDWSIDRLAVEIGLEASQLKQALKDPQAMTLDCLGRIAEALRMRFAIEERL